jgi:hypothetical protein
VSDEQPVTESAMKAARDVPCVLLGNEPHRPEDWCKDCETMRAFAAEAVKAERERVLQVLGFARDAFDGSAHPVQWRESIDAVIAEIDAVRATKEQAR